MVILFVPPSASLGLVRVRGLNTMPREMDRVKKGGGNQSEGLGAFMVAQ